MIRPSAAQRVLAPTPHASILPPGLPAVARRRRTRPRGHNLVTNAWTLVRSERDCTLIGIRSTSHHAASRHDEALNM
jgi:hypothetical protein